MQHLRNRIIVALVAGLASHAIAEDAAHLASTVGTVVSTQNSGPYTYVELDIKGSAVWYAVPATELNPGETVVAPAGMPMQNFYSKTLDRTFATVYFADGLERSGSPNRSDTLPSGHPPPQSVLPAGHPPIGSTLPPDHPPLKTTTNSACCTQ